MRSILHVDMDAFFASVEVLDDPTLKGKPLLVGGVSGRGVVAAASYESRVYGCRSAMPMSQALRLCPHAIVRKPRFHRYKEISRKVFDIFERYTPLVQGLSIDEAFLDLTGTERLLGPAAQVARRIKEDIRGETGCTGSVGVSFNKFLAKLASDMDKPDGLTILGPAEVEARLPALPVTRIWGVGPAMAKRLAGYAIHTIADLRRADVAFLTARFGDEAQRLIDLSFGRDDRPVTPDRDAKSIGNENTFPEDLTQADEVRAAILEEAESVAARCRKAGLVARTVTVKIRTSDFRTVTRSRTRPAPTNLTADIWAEAKSLFDTWALDHFAPIRLIGVTAKDLSPLGGAQLDLFGGAKDEQQSKVDAATDRIRAKFGKEAIKRLGP